MGFKFNRRILNGETTNHPSASTTLSSLDQAAVEAAVADAMAAVLDGGDYGADADAAAAAAAVADAMTALLDGGDYGVVLTGSHDPIAGCGHFETYLQELDCNFENNDYLQNYGQNLYDTDEEWIDAYTDYYNDKCSTITDFSVPDCKLSLYRCEETHLLYNKYKLFY